MKTRHGFVSNSSSSSFIVIRKDFLQNGHKSLITKKEEALLNKFGFKKVWCFHSNQVDTESDGLPESICKGRENEYNYGYFVSCNQTDVIYFLLKNKIPFEASIHYNHSNIVYNRGSEDFIEAQNYGEQLIMGGFRSSCDKAINLVLNHSPKSIEKTNVKQWLKEEEKWQKEFKKETSKSE